MKRLPAFAVASSFTVAGFLFTAGQSHAEQVVFSEVMYHPPAGSYEFVEVQNLTATPFDIVNWRLADGVDYEFPDFTGGTDSFLKAFERIVICETDPATFRAAYGLPGAVRVFGPWAGTLSDRGERVTLQDKNGVTRCTLRYDDKDGWPVAADGGGHSLILADDSLAIDDYRLWIASPSRGGTPGSPEPAEAEEPFPNPEVDLSTGIPYIQYGDKWDFNDQNLDVITPVDPGDASWTATNYAYKHAGWTLENAGGNNGGLYGFENSALPAPGIQTGTLNSNDAANHMSYYFRKEFTYNGPLAGVTLTVDLINDDGAGFWLNGTWIGGQAVTAGANHGDTAGRTVGNAAEELGIISSSAAPLVNGTNVVAVLGKQTNAGSSDFVFGARVSISAPSAPSVVINEVLPAGAGSGFVEFYNPTGSSIDLGGYYLSDTPGDLTQFQIPGVLNIGPSGLASVGYTESSLSISSPTVVYLTDPDGTTVVSAISSSMPLDGRSLGRKPEGSGAWFLFTSPTQDAPNSSAGGLGSFLSINELHFDALDEADWVEVHNSGGTAVTTTGLSIASLPDFSDKIALGGSIPAGGFASWTTSFPVDGGGDLQLFLIDGADNVLDAVAVTRQNGRDHAAAFPDGSATFYTSASGSRDTANNPDRSTAIVINEIMVEPPSGHRDGEFIELHNKSGSTVNLTGWEFDLGVNYIFPSGTTIPAGGYLVVAANPTLTSSAFPSATVPYTGNLSNSGERLRLIDEWDNPADWLHYHTAGDWPQLAAGQGSSLELRHPDMDNSKATAWADSDESAKSSWQNFSFTEQFQQLRTQGGTSDYKELHLFGVGDAHIALRNVALLRGGSNILPGGGETVSHNGNGSGGWLCQGTHHASDTINGEFHVISTGHGDNKANRCEIDVTSMNQNDTLTFSCEGRWISGKPTIVVNTWDRSFGGVLHLDVPLNLGTAGAANSSALANPAPTVSELRHSPPVPSSSDPVIVSARVESATALTSVNVHHRADSSGGAGAYQTTAMNDSGIGGDEAAGDGIYSATLTQYQGDNSIVQFYVQASAAGGSSITPGLAPERPAMWVVDNTSHPTDLRTERFVISAYDLASLNVGTGESASRDYDFPRLSNQYFNATFISDDKDIFYNCEIRKSGSPWTRDSGNGLSKAKWKTAGDKRFRGYSKRSIDSDAGGGRAYHGRIIRYWLYLFGHAANENEFVRVIYNGGGASLREDLEPNANDFLKRNWEDGEKGELYRIDDEWWFTDSWSRANRNADWSYKGTHEPERYHAEWIKRSRETEYDFSSFTTWVNKVGTNSFTREEIERLSDIDMMAANAVVRGWCDDWDTLTRNRGKNGYFLRRYSDGKWMLVQWDSDLTFGSSGAAFFGGLAGVRNYFDKPYVRQRVNYYLGKMRTDFGATQPRLQAWFQCEEDASNSYGSNEGTYTNWHNSRVGRAQTEMGGSFSTNFNVTTGNGSSTTTSADTISLGGTSGWEAFTIRAAGHPEARWEFSTQTGWTLSGIQLEEGPNVLTVEAVDEIGNVIDSEVYTVNKTGNALPVIVLNPSPGSLNVDLSDALDLDASTSYDPEGTGLSFAWSVSPAAGSNLTGASSPVATSTFGSPGLYSFTLVATDGDGEQKTLTREAAVYAASGWSPFTEPLLENYWSTDNLDLRYSGAESAWYSLDDRPGKLVMQVLDDSSKPLTMSNPQHPALWRDLPTSTDWSLHTDLKLDTLQQGDFISGLIVELQEGATTTRYVLAIEDGDFLRVKRSTGGSYTQLSTMSWTEGSATVRIRRAGNQLLFERRGKPGEWISVHTRAISAGSTAIKGGIFAAKDTSTTSGRFEFDYVLLVDPGLSNDYLDALRITEIMYNAPGGTGVEYIELTNTGGAPIDLDGVSFDMGAPFDPLTLPTHILNPGERVIITNDEAAFIAVYGNGPTVIATWSGGALSNGGEEVIMRDPDGNIVHRFTYDDSNGWPPRADGGGSSLEIIDSNGNYSDENNWRASTEFGGSPGSAGSGPSGELVITEILSHTDAPALDTVEIRNTSAAPVDISGWYLSDSDVNWQKYLIPNSTVIGVGDYITFDEADFNPNGAWNPNAGPPALWEFGISSHGDQIYLIEASGTTPISYAADRDFGAARNGVSFGSYTNSQSEEFFTAQKATSLGADNGEPKVGPLVITEIMYQNAPGGMDWIEIQNISGSEIPLFDATTGAVWKLAGLGFDFPAGQTMPVGGVALIVSGDPATFRTMHSIPANIPIYGPYPGNLQDDGENLRLEMPEPLELVPEFIEIDAVRYDEVAPWPTGALGTGHTIERTFVAEFGTDPVNWDLSTDPGGTPGVSSLPPAAPRIDSSVNSLVAGVSIGENAPAQSFVIANSGIGTLNYDITDDVTWLSVAAASGSSTGLADTTSHTVTYSTTGLSGGTHNATITIADPSADNSPFTIPVTLTVVQPILSVGSTAYNISAQEGQDASNENLDIWNDAGGASMGYSVSADVPWIGVTPSAGSSSGPGDVQSHTITLSTAGLATGNYNGNITVIAPSAAGSPKIIPVTLNVSEGLLVCLDSRGLNTGPVGSWANTGLLGGNFVAEFDDPVAGDVSGVRAVTLDGNNDWYVGPTAPSELTGNNPHSIEAWVYNPINGAVENVASWGRRGGSAGGLVSFNHGTDPNFGGIVHWGSLANSAGWEDEEENAIWTHIVYVYNGSGTSSLYTNGILTISKSHDPLNVDTEDTGGSPLPLLLGNQNEGDGSRVNSTDTASTSVALLKIYATPLSAGAVEDRYNIEAANFGRSPTPNIDLDGDGLNATEEATYGTDPNNPDTDGDGFTDGQEVALGTDPLDPNSKLDWADDGASRDVIGNVTLEWESVPGRSYQVEHSDDVSNWSVIATVPASAGATTSYVDTAAAGEARGFYRITLAP